MRRNEARAKDARMLEAEMSADSPKCNRCGAMKKETNHEGMAVWYCPNERCGADAWNL